MQNKINQIQKFLLKNIPEHPNNIVAVTMEHFDVGRTTVNRHLQPLIKSNQVIKTGNTKQTHYALASSLSQTFTVNINAKFDEFSIFSQLIEPAIKPQLNKSAFNIYEYCATEMLNNAHDHSHGKKIIISVNINNNEAYLSISDDGTGLFKHINDYLNFEDMRDVILELSKGKLTTDEVNHTGEGVFFSSRACDIFSITANGYRYERNNIENDWSFCSASRKAGTEINMQLRRDTKTNLTDIFLKYQDGETLEFNKTDIIIELSKNLGERLISRSQAKRVLRRLENFKHVTLDFKNIQAIGQGFVDEVFRVYQQKNPDITFAYINAGDDVEFMIKRGIANK